MYVVGTQATKSISLTPGSVSKTMLQQGAIGLLLGLGLACELSFDAVVLPTSPLNCCSDICLHIGGGFVRVYLTNGSLLNSAAISLSLFTIVMTSVLTGTALPFALAKSGVDPANGGTVIQVHATLRLLAAHALQALPQPGRSPTNPAWLTCRC